MSHSYNSSRENIYPRIKTLEPLNFTGAAASKIPTSTVLTVIQPVLTFHGRGICTGIGTDNGAETRGYTNAKVTYPPAVRLGLDSWGRARHHCHIILAMSWDKGIRPSQRRRSESV